MQLCTVFTYSVVLLQVRRLHNFCRLRKQWCSASRVSVMFVQAPGEDDDMRKNLSTVSSPEDLLSEMQVSALIGQSLMVQLLQKVTGLRAPHWLATYWTKGIQKHRALKQYQEDGRCRWRKTMRHWRDRSLCSGRRCCGLQHLLQTQTQALYFWQTFCTAPAFLQLLPASFHTRAVAL